MHGLGFWVNLAVVGGFLVCQGSIQFVKVLKLIVTVLPLNDDMSPQKEIDRRKGEYLPFSVLMSEATTL